MLHRSLTTIASHPRWRLRTRDVRERLEHYARVMRGAASLATRSFEESQSTSAYAYRSDLRDFRADMAKA